MDRHTPLKRCNLALSVFLQFLRKYFLLTDRLTEGPMDGSMDRRTDHIPRRDTRTQRNFFCAVNVPFPHFYESVTDEWTDGLTDQQTNRPSTLTCTILSVVLSLPAKCAAIAVPVLQCLIYPLFYKCALCNERTIK